MAEKLKLQDIEVWDGNMAFAQAMRQAQIDVVAAYPITPSTPTVHGYAKFLADGYIDGEFVLVESEHAAMSGCVGAAAAGGRVATATSSQGFALMVEVLYQASGMRLPIVLGLVNRWIMIDAFNAQEAYDLMLMGFKIAEDLSVRLPVMVNQDGFITSHTAQNVKPLQDDDAYNFIGEYKEVNPMLDFCKPVTYGAQTEEDWHFEFKARQHKALMDSQTVIEKVFGEFKSLTGREYNLVESYLMDDAEVAIVALGSTVESAVQAAKDLREKEGIKAGVVATRVIRPFPFEEVKNALKNVKAIATLDRSAPGGTLGMLYNEISAASLS